MYLSRNHKVSLARGVCVRSLFLSVDADGNVLSTLRAQLFDAFLGNGQDAASAASTVINAIGGVLQLVGNGLDGQVGKQLHIISWRKVLTSLGHIILLVKPPQQFLKYSTHRVIVERRKFLVALVVKNRLVAEIYMVRGEFLNDAAQTFCLRQIVNHLAKMQFFHDVKHILAVTVQIFDEVHLQSLSVYFALQCLHRKLRGVVERVACHII